VDRLTVADPNDAGHAAIVHSRTADSRPWLPGPTWRSVTGHASQAPAIFSLVSGPGWL